MRKIILGIFIVLGLSFFGVQSAQAGGCIGTCSDWQCTSYPDGSGGYYSDCTCNDILVSGGQQAACTAVSCGTGTYVCNTGCCGVGGSCSTNADCDGGCCGGGSCGKCSGGGSCDWVKRNCPPGYVKNTTGTFSDYCGIITGCPAPGTAQSKIAPGCGGTYCAERGTCYFTPSGVEKCPCTEWLYRRQTIRTYGCTPIASTPPPCSATAPAVPTLSSPTNGISLAVEDVTLLWNSMSIWGTGCPANDNELQVFVSTTNPPPTTTPYSILAATDTTEMFTGAYGTTYYWMVRASNGSLFTDSAVRSFTILDNEISGTIYYDPNNTCSTSTPWTTSALTVSANPGSYSDATSTSNGQYLINAPPATNAYALSFGLPSGFICSAGTGCNTCTRSSVDSPSSGSGNNFYITDSREAWWHGVDKL